MGYSGREIRYWLLTGHYRKPIAFAPDRLEEARRALKRLDACVRSLLGVKAGRPYAEIDQLLYDIRNGFVSAMDDDLNMSAAMASIFKNVKKINILTFEERIDAAGALKIVETLRQIDAVLNVFDFGEAPADGDTQALVAAREKARLKKTGRWPIGYATS